LKNKEETYEKKAMSPSIVNAVSYTDFAAKNGMVDYGEDEDDIDLTYAGLSRVGNHPLFIKANLSILMKI
jgi:hypothetical protein